MFFIDFALYSCGDVKPLAKKKNAGVRCNRVRHAILSAPDTFAYAIVSGVMQKPSGGHVHACTCMCARKRACMHWTYVHAAWIFTYFMIAANTQRPNISHVIHDMHLACKKWRTCSVDQGRLIYCKDGFARGGHNCICKCVLRIVLHRGHNRMRPEILNPSLVFGDISYTFRYKSIHRLLVLCLHI